MRKWMRLVHSDEIDNGPLRRPYSAMSCLFSGVAFGLFAQVAFAQPPPYVVLQYSADMGGNTVSPAGYAARSDYVLDDTFGTRVRVQIPGLPDTADLKDFQLDADNSLLFALDVGVTLNGIYFDPADVIDFAGGSFSKAFDAAAAGVPKGVHCDGIARAGVAGALLLSFDRTFAVGGITVRPADVISFAGDGFGTKVLDARDLGLADNLNIDAIDSLGTTSELLVSFDRGGKVGNVSFADEDILQVHLVDGTWSKRYALLGFSDRWNAANLDGLATAPNDDVLFRDGFE